MEVPLVISSRISYSVITFPMCNEYGGCLNFRSLDTYLGAVHKLCCLGSQNTPIANSLLLFKVFIQQTLIFKIIHFYYLGIQNIVKD